jgi:hypothetical protein
MDDDRLSSDRNARTSDAACLISRPDAFRIPQDGSCPRPPAWAGGLVRGLSAPIAKGRIGTGGQQHPDHDGIITHRGCLMKRGAAFGVAPIDVATPGDQEPTASTQ